MWEFIGQGKGCTINYVYVNVKFDEVRGKIASNCFPFAHWSDMRVRFSTEVIMAELISTPNALSNKHRVLDALSAGDCVAIPTETVYGLAADATNGQAVAQIFKLKNRPKFNPLICHVSDISMAEQLGFFSRVARELCDHFWPGPLTVVVPVKPDSGVHDLVTAGLATIGLRCPLGVSNEIIGHFGKPLAAPSANRSGRISPTTAQHVIEEFSDQSLLVVDNGPCEVGLESTIVEVSSSAVRILRPGFVTNEAISRVVDVPVEYHNGNGEILAPGMMHSHYAPNAKVVLNCHAAGEREVLLGFGKINGVLNLSENENLLEAAANLYGYLKELDRLTPKAICVAPIPNDGLGLAINDRLKRAAAPRE